MPVYHYRAVDKSGHRLNGTMPALDEVALGQKLREAELWLTDVGLHRSTEARRDRTATVRSHKLRGKSGRRELIDFSTLMTYQLRAGIPIVKSIEAAAQDCKNPGFTSVLVDLGHSIE